MYLFTPFEDAGLISSDPYSVNVESFSIYFYYEKEPTIESMRDLLDALEDFLNMTSNGFDVKYSFVVAKNRHSVTLTIKNKTQELKSELSEIIEHSFSKNTYALQGCEYIKPNKVVVNNFSMYYILNGPHGVRKETYVRWVKSIINDMVEVYDGTTGKKKIVDTDKINYNDFNRYDGVNNNMVKVKKDKIKVINQDLYNEAKLRCASLCFPKTKLNMKFDYENSIIEFELKRRRGE